MGSISFLVFLSAFILSHFYSSDLCLCCIFRVFFFRWHFFSVFLHSEHSQYTIWQIEKEKERERECVTANSPTMARLIANSLCVHVSSHFVFLFFCFGIFFFFGSKDTEICSNESKNANISVFSVLEGSNRIRNVIFVRIEGEQEQIFQSTDRI